MKTNLKMSWAITFLMLASISVDGQTPMANALTKLMNFEGHWEGVATITMNGNTMKSNMHATFEKTADGKGLIMHEQDDKTDASKMRATHLVGFNQGDSKIHWFTVDNMGSATDNIGDWANENQFVMKSTQMMGNNKVESVGTMNMKGADQCDLIVTSSSGGKEVFKLTATYNRVKKCSMM